MTGAQLRAIRTRLGVTAAEFGEALGYESSPEGRACIVYGLEHGRRITPAIARLSLMFAKYGIPASWDHVDA